LASRPKCSMPRIGCLLLLWAFGGGEISHAQGTDQGRIAALENAWNQALVLKDAKAIASLMAPELVYIEYDGTVMTKASYLLSLKDTSVKFEHVVSDSMQVQMYARSAIVTGIYRESGSRNGKPYSRRERFVDTWINQNNAWLCVASQSTLITH
jgi:ketosteroid isomerase-like protein